MTWRATPSRHDVPGRIWLTGYVCTPKDDHVRVLSHILLGARLPKKTHWCCGPAHKGILDCPDVLGAADTLGLAAFYLDQYPAKRWMAVHGTHGPRDFRAASLPFRFRPVRERSSCKVKPTSRIAS